jgi:hypothetical protein
MNRYDPLFAPDPERWLSIDEQDRLLLIQEYHKRLHLRLPNLTLHAAIHTAVENQLALLEQEVADALTRLTDGGLDRHEAVHAIGSVLVGNLFDGLRGTAPLDDLPSAYRDQLRDLNAEAWLNGQ